MKNDNIDYKSLCERLAKLSGSEIVETRDDYGSLIVFKKLKPKEEYKNYLSKYRIIARSPHSRWKNKDLYKDFIMECRINKLKKLKNSRYRMLMSFFHDIGIIYNNQIELQMKLDLRGV